MKDKVKLVGKEGELMEKVGRCREEDGDCGEGRDAVREEGGWCLGGGMGTAGMRGGYV